MHVKAASNLSNFRQFEREQVRQKEQEGDLFPEFLIHLPGRRLPCKLN